ncbi:UPF0061-domain-containing protein [Backusella circina FSU 941]|nr:UPF0061-domain-containing protein [Backusella circina FSU 941]
MKTLYELPSLPTKITNELPGDSLTIEDKRNPLMWTPRAVYKSVYSFVLPDSAPGATLLSVSKAAQQEIEVETDNDAFLKVFSGEKILTRPWSLCYAGHQFGNFVILGDGRAMSLFETTNSHGKRYELQLKGSGRTPYSRFADGYATLASSIREYLGSEYLHALGVPTTRALCLISTDRTVFREDSNGPEKTAIVTRMAPSWLRYGNFELFCARDDMDNVRKLADYVIKEVITKEDQEEEEEEEMEGNQYARMFKTVTRLMAKLVAEWQAIGFNHGVMNTDNMSILGLTLDFGPFQIMDYYDPTYICNHSDIAGRYAFRRQPSSAIANLAKLAASLLELIGAGKDVDTLVFPGNENSTDQATLEMYRSRGRQYIETVISSYFTDKFMDHLLNKMGAKLGLKDPSQKDMSGVIVPLLDWLTAHAVDYHRFYRSLSNFQTKGDVKEAMNGLDIIIKDESKLDACKKALEPWLWIYSQRLLQQDDDDDERRKARMVRVNPRFVLRNTILQDVIDAFQEDDVSKAKEVLDVCLEACLDPYKEHYQDQRLEDWIAMKVPNKDMRCSCNS